MGGSQSKPQEIIIAQAGNSGGQTNTPTTNASPRGIGEILGITAFGLVVFLLVILVIRGCCVYKKRMEKRIAQSVRREMQKSSKALALGEVKSERKTEDI